jgi:hypothetical protein
MADSLSVWKQMGDARRGSASLAFYADSGLKDFHRAAETFIGRAKNFRPQFVHKLPVEKRAQYLANLPLTPDLASQLIVSYHFAHQRPMMAAFLDALHVANENGLIKEDVEMAAPAEGDLESAVKTLRSQFPHEDVDIYLLTLQTQNPDIWAGLAKHTAGIAA